MILYFGKEDTIKNTSTIEKKIIVLPTPICLSN